MRRRNGDSCNSGIITGVYNFHLCGLRNSCICLITSFYCCIQPNVVNTHFISIIGLNFQRTWRICKYRIQWTVIYINQIIWNRRAGGKISSPTSGSKILRHSWLYIISLVMNPNIRCNDNSFTRINDLNSKNFWYSFIWKSSKTSYKF